LIENTFFKKQENVEKNNKNINNYIVDEIKSLSKNQLDNPFDIDTKPNLVNPILIENTFFKKQENVEKNNKNINNYIVDEIKSLSKNQLDEDKIKEIIDDAIDQLDKNNKNINDYIIDEIKSLSKNQLDKDKIKEIIDDAIGPLEKKINELIYTEKLKLQMSGGYQLLSRRNLFKQKKFI
jgi:Glu-tRNA(Gln) amidotransferase subunit E-like FAD-binding protein